MKIRITLGLICLLIIAGNYVFENYIFEPKKETISNFLGPVPQDYDEQYFRLTGITKPLEGKK